MLMRAPTRAGTIWTVLLYAFAVAVLLREDAILVACSPVGQDLVARLQVHGSETHPLQPGIAAVRTRAREYADHQEDLVFGHCCRSRHGARPAGPPGCRRGRRSWRA